MGQNATQYGESQYIGSVTMFAAPVATPTVFTELGIGEAFGYTENRTPLDGTPDNGEKPIALDGDADATIDFNGTLWTYKLSLIALMRGGIDSLVVDPVSGETTLSSGGLSAQSSVVVKAVQKTRSFATAADVLRWVTTPTGSTLTFVEGDPIIRVLTWIGFKTLCTSGEAVTFTNDKDGNPILKYPFTFTGTSDPLIVDGTGNLFSRAETVEEPS